MKRRSPTFPTLALATLLLTGSAGSCSEPARAPTTPSVPDVREAELGRADVRLVVVTDLMGMLEPCGCTSRPLGGIDRFAAQLETLRGGDAPPVVLVAAGDLFFGSTHPGAGIEGAETQELWRAQLVADLMHDFGLAAAAPGTDDLTQGLDVLESLRERVGVPLLGGVRFSAAEAPAAPAEGGEAPSEAPAPRPTPEPLATHTLVTAGELRIGIVGISEMSGAGASPPADPVATATEAAAAVRADGAGVVIALVSGDRRTARRIANGAEGVDLVVSGGLDEAEAHVPTSTDGALILHAGRHGQGLLVVDVFRREGGHFADVSTWTRTTLRDHLVEQATELRERIAAWENDPSARAEDVEAQRARLRALESETDAVARAPETAGPAISARYVELAPEMPRDPEVTARMDAHDVRVNEHNRVAFASWLPEPAPEGTPSYVGTETCGGCHVEEHDWWRTTLHGHAYATLVDQHKEYNLDCVGCHVTGWLRPGGSTVSHVGPLRDVGCENCHGPGSLHIAGAGHASAPDVDVHRDVGEDTCLRCHTPEHSDRFVYETYRGMMIAPGHGLPREGAAGTEATE